MRYRVTNLTRNTLLAEHATRADRFAARLKGLVGVTQLPAGQGLHLEPCASIHTFFMMIPIDALFLDARHRVVDVRHALMPWRVSRVGLDACSVLELPAGTARATGTAPGDQLRFVPAETTAPASESSHTAAGPTRSTPRPARAAAEEPDRGGGEQARKREGKDPLKRARFTRRGPVGRLV